MNKIFLFGIVITTIAFSTSATSKSSGPSDILNTPSTTYNTLAPSKPLPSSEPSKPLPPSKPFSTADVSDAPLAPTKPLAPSKPSPTPSAPSKPLAPAKPHAPSAPGSNIFEKLL